MNDIPVETIAIVNATYADVNAQRTAITLRMWHYMLPYAEREALFINLDTGSGQSSTLLPAFLTGIQARTRGGWPSMRPPTGLGPEQLPMLVRAFGQALRDVLGRLGAPMVINAWCEMLRTFLAAICRPDQGPDPI